MYHQKELRFHHNGQFMKIDAKDFIALMKDKKNMLILKDAIYDHTEKRWYNALAYHVNNVTAMVWSPIWIWSFACDVSYYLSSRTKIDLSKYIWFIIDHMRYFTYLVDWQPVDPQEDHTKLFIHRLKLRFPFMKWDFAKWERYFKE